jgi:uncharacterized protein (TIGR02001 family)
MRFRHACGAAGLALTAQLAGAETTISVTALTDYDFRGISQTEGDPAIQPSIDWAGELFYGTIWASNIDFGDDVDGNVEVDLVAGLAGETEGGWRWDVGATWYLYPGSTADPNLGISDSPDYWEYSVAGGYGPLDIKYWYSPDLYDSGETASYLEANASFGLPAELSLNLHAGYNFGDYFDMLSDSIVRCVETDPPDPADCDPAYAGEDADYYDYSVGLGRSFGRFDFEVKYVGTVTDGDYFDVDTGTFRNDERVIFSVATTFPWTDEESEE